MLANQLIIQPTTAGLLHGAPLNMALFCRTIPLSEINRELPDTSATEEVVLSESNTNSNNTSNVSFSSKCFKNELISKQEKILADRQTASMTIDQTIAHRKQLLQMQQQTMQQINEEKENCKPAQEATGSIQNHQPYMNQTFTGFTSLQNTVRSQQFRRLPNVETVVERRNKRKTIPLEKRVKFDSKEGSEEHRSLAFFDEEEISFSNEDSENDLDSVSGSCSVVCTMDAPAKPSLAVERDTNVLPTNCRQQQMAAESNQSEIFWRQTNNELSCHANNNYRDICKSPAFETLQHLTEELDAEIAMLELCGIAQNKCSMKATLF